MTSIEEHVLMVLSFIMPIYITAFLLYIVRALKGPTIPDIVLAIDALSYDLAAFLAILAIYLKDPILIPGASAVTAVLILILAPTGTHLLARAAHRSRTVEVFPKVVDHLEEDRGVKE